MSTRLTGSAAGARRRPQSADVLRRLARNNCGALVEVSQQLHHDASLIELHARGVAPERAVDVLRAASADIQRCLARLERQAGRLRL